MGLHMPYQVAFSKKVEAPDRDLYFNECCIGGDVIAERLLPALRKQYEDIRFNQEDWGWFVWFRKGSIRLGIDIFCDDPGKGEYRIHLTSRKPRWFFSDGVMDLPELEELRSLVAGLLEGWVQTPCRTTRASDFRSVVR